MIYLFGLFILLNVAFLVVFVFVGSFKNLLDMYQLVFFFFFFLFKKINYIIIFYLGKTFLPLPCGYSVHDADDIAPVDDNGYSYFQKSPTSFPLMH